MYKKIELPTKKIVKHYLKNAINDITLHTIIINWPDIVGRILSLYSVPYTIYYGEQQNNTLNIFVYDSSASITLQYKKLEIIENIAITLGCKTIHNITLKQKPAPSTNTNNNI